MQPSRTQRQLQIQLQLVVRSVLPGSPGRATQNSISSISGMSRSLVSTCWTCHVGYHVISTHAHRLRLHGGACTTARSCTAVQRYPRTTVKFTAVRVRAAAALEHTPRAAKCRTRSNATNARARLNFHHQYSHIPSPISSKYIVKFNTGISTSR